MAASKVAVFLDYQNVHLTARRKWYSLTFRDVGSAYNRISPSTRVQELLTEIDSDPTGIFRDWPTPSPYQSYLRLRRRRMGIA